MTQIVTALRMVIWMMMVTGFIYPLFITFIAQTVAHHKAEGSLIDVNGTLVGSTLIGQNFFSNKYFWPRPSIGDYDPLRASGSNLAPTSRRLQEQVQERRRRLLAASLGTNSDVAIPSDLLYASGSGLDPHITLEGALWQVNRVAHARGIPEAKVISLLTSNVKGEKFYLMFPPRINVLELNILLDSMEDSSHG